MFIEKSCLASLMFDEEYCRRVLPYLKKEYFTDESNRILFEMTRSFSAKYNRAPSKEALALLLEDSSLNETIFEAAIETINEIAPTDVPTDFMVESTEKWAKDRAIFLALTEAIAIADGGVKDKTKEAIPEILQQALSVHFDSYLGHDYFEHASAHYDMMHLETTKFKFGIEIMNKVTRGGVPNKTLNIVQAGINTGKTTWLINDACHWVSQGKNAIYFSAEVAENVIRHRADTNLLDVTFDELEKLPKHTYLAGVNSIKAKTNGKLIIKEYPSGSASASNFIHDLVEIQIKLGIKFDVIYVDYLGEIISSTLPQSAMSNTNTYYTQVARELRAIGFRFDCPVWTAAQFGREGQKATGAKDIDMTAIADAIGIARVADFMIALIQPEDLAELDQVIAKILKNRYSNKAKLRQFLLGVDNDKQRFFDVEQANVKDEYKVSPGDNAVIAGITAGLAEQLDDDCGLVVANGVGRKQPPKSFDGWNI